MDGVQMRGKDGCVQMRGKDGWCSDEGTVNVKMDGVQMTGR